MTIETSISRALRGFRKALLPLCVCLVAVLGSSIVCAQETRIISFDAPGADTTAGDFNGTVATGINNWGTITGYFIDVTNVAHGFLRSPKGSFTTFEAPGADTTAGSFNGTSVNSIKDLGAVAGEYWDANGFGHGFLRTPEGKFTTFDVPGAGGYGTTPIALNIEGAVVGYYTDSNYLFHAFLRRPDGTFGTWVGPDACDTNGSQGCYGTGASNINAFGTIAGGWADNSGNFVHHDFLRRADGKLTTFDAPGAGTGSNQGTGCPGCFSGLNQFGATAGIYIDANNVQHGFLRSREGKFTTFDAPGAGTDTYQGTGCPSDCPTILNDWGAITGVYIDANYVPHGYLRSPEGKFATIDPQGSAGTLPSSMNDLGSITGYYIDANNVFHGFLTIPGR